jgi:hypothetical protein
MFSTTQRTAMEKKRALTGGQNEMLSGVLAKVGHKTR